MTSDNVHEHLCVWTHSGLLPVPHRHKPVYPSRMAGNRTEVKTANQQAKEFRPRVFQTQ